MMHRLSLLCKRHLMAEQSAELDINVGVLRDFDVLRHPRVVLTNGFGGLSI